MRDYVLSPAADSDIESILVWTGEHFGESALLRYQALLIQAVFDLADDPARAGTQPRPEIAASARTYHLRHSRDNVALATGRVKRPRHFILYRLRDDGVIEIGRVLHESMDLGRHLPAEYRAKGEKP